MRPSNFSLLRASIADLINDYRATHSDFASGEMPRYHDTQAMADLAEYAYRCKCQAIELFRKRHSAEPNRYGSFI